MQLQLNKKAYTYIEILISLIIVSIIMGYILNVLMILYKINLRINTMNSLSSQVVYMQGYLRQLFTEAKADSINCTPQNIDVNNDGEQDVLLVQFTTLPPTSKDYAVAWVKNIRINGGARQYSAIYVLEHNGVTFVPVVTLTQRDFNLLNFNVSCSNVIENAVTGRTYRSITFSGTAESTVLQKDVLIRGGNGALISDLPILVDVLIKN